MARGWQQHRSAASRPTLVAAAMLATALSAPGLGEVPAARAAMPRPPRAAVPAATAPRLDELGGHASGHLHLQLSRGVSPHRLEDGRWTLRRDGAVDLAVASAFAAAKVKSIVPALSRTPADAALAVRLGLDRFVRVEVPAGSDTLAIAAELGRLRGWVELAEVDGIGGVAGGAEFPPNDPLFAMQWHLHNTGQAVNGVPGSVGSDIDPAAAWARTTGRPEIVVAVLDSGINPHAELAGRVLAGWNAPQGSTSTIDNCSSHGTHVSGILAARGGNAMGVAGLAWGVRLLPVVVVNPCSGLESWLAEGLVFATDAGADVANMSLQFSVGSELLRNAVRYAADSGVILVAASGNSGASSLAFPARWPETIAVGGSTNTDARWTSSNFGSNLSLLAPAVGIRSLVGSDLYGDKTGTSMAAPQVSGTVALMLSANPRLCVGRVRSILEATAADLGSPGYDLFTGHGRLSAGAAVAAVPIPADLDGNCIVDGADLAALLGAWGPCGDPVECPADLDGNGMVDGADLALLLGAWGG